MHFFHRISFSVQQFNRSSLHHGITTNAPYTLAFTNMKCICIGYILLQPVLENIIISAKTTFTAGSGGEKNWYGWNVEKKKWRLWALILRISTCGKYSEVGIWLGRKYSLPVYWLFDYLTIEEAKMLIPSTLTAQSRSNHGKLPMVPGQVMVNYY